MINSNAVLYYTSDLLMTLMKETRKHVLYRDCFLHPPEEIKRIGME